MFAGCSSQIRITNSLMDAFKGYRNVYFKLVDMQEIKISRVCVCVCVSNAKLTINSQLCL